MNDNFNIAKNFFEIGENLFSEKKYEQAEKNFNLSLKFLPNRVSTLINLGLCKIKLKKYEECEVVINQVNDLKDNSFEFKNLKCLYYGETLQFEKAIDEINSCLKLKNLKSSDLSNLLNYQGIAYSKIDQYSKSIDLQKKAIEINPENYDAQCNLGFNNLVLGNFDDGWKQYEFRLKKNNLNISKYPNIISDIKNKKILIKSEQGIGDMIMFSRFLPNLLSYTTQIDVEIPKSLELFFNNKDFNFITKNNFINNYDFEIFIGSLPYFFNAKDQIIYDKNLLNHEIFNNKNDQEGKFKIGLAWSGNRNFRYDILRSLSLENLKKLFSLDPKRYEFYCLQKDIKENDKELFDQLNLKYYGNYNFFELSKKISNFDLVVSSDTSILHLASTLGLRTFGLISHTPDWRWMLEGNKSYWYENLRLFRQSRNETWEHVINKVHDVIKDLN